MVRARPQLSRDPLGGGKRVVRRKRFHHHADNLCQIFCGWQLMFDYPALESLGSGELRIEVLAERCSHNGQPIPPLKIATALNVWLREDLEAHSIPVSSINEAVLVVLFATERHRGQRQAGSWARPKPFFVGCSLTCASTIASGPDLYRSSYQDQEEWPSPFEVS